MKFERLDQKDRIVFKQVVDAPAKWKRFEFYPTENRVVLMCSKDIAGKLEGRARTLNLVGPTLRLDTQAYFCLEKGANWQDARNKEYVQINHDDMLSFIDVILYVAREDLGLDSLVIDYMKAAINKDYSAVINKHFRDGMAPIHKAIYMVDINHDSDDLRYQGLMGCLNKGADVNLKTRTFKPYTALDLTFLNLSNGTFIHSEGSEKNHPLAVTSLLLSKGAEPQSAQLVNMLRALGTYGSDFFPLMQQIARGEDYIGLKPLWDQEYIDLMYTCVALCLHYGAKFEIIMQGLQASIRKEAAYTDDFAAEKAVEIRTIVEPEILRCYNQAVKNGTISGVVKQHVLEIGTGDDFMGFEVVPVALEFSRPRNKSQ